MKMNSISDDDPNENIDLEFLNTNIGQFKQVFSDLDFLGWYTTGGVPDERDIILHKQVCTINESPVLLKLDPFGKQTDLPVSVYESVIDIIKGEVTMLFIELEYTLATEEAERIGVDHIAKHSSSNTLVKSSVADHLSAQYAAISLLNNRIRVIYEYVKAVKDNNNVKKNNEILREIQSLCNRLPVMNSPNFHKEFYTVNLIDFILTYF
jgi:COP9 signalosome complex subunit 6